MNLLKSTLIIATCCVCAYWVVTTATGKPINEWSFLGGWFGAVASGVLQELIASPE